MLHTQESGGGRGVPHLLHGLYPTIDDLAKLPPCYSTAAAIRADNY
jgi:hypothetical protein